MKKLKILFLSSEVYPFAKTGGLADVSNSLPRALKELGHEVRIIMPKYKIINDRKYVLREVIRLRNISIPIGDSEKKINVKSAFTPDSLKLQIYFIDFRQYFAREGLYVDAKTNKEYPDNDERFILFAKAVFKTLKLLYWQPDVIHCNDWQSGLVPFFLKTKYKDDEFFKNTATLLTIHNVGYQGNFPKESYLKTNSDPKYCTPGGLLEFYNKFSFLKAGINYADYINTVSGAYAEEIQSHEEYGMGFEGILRDKKKIFTGILNGVDYKVWNPETDKLIPQTYTYANIGKKAENKKALVEKCGFAFDENVPLIGIISRLDDQKGFDILEQAFDEILNMNVQMVVLGVGDKKYHKMLSDFEKKHSGKLSVNLRFDDELAHLIEAGADMFLMPSRYEPCGLNQLFSLKYGTVPIVRKTGGLADTIKEFDPEKGKGNGFVFEEYKSSELLKAVKRALELYKKPKIWKKLIRNGMKQDFSWTVSAKKYSKLYERIINKLQ